MEVRFFLVWEEGEEGGVLVGGLPWMREPECVKAFA
jgi:hypothetical protein